MRFALIILFIITSVLKANITDEYPELKKHLFVEPKSNFKLGLGVVPLGANANHVYHALSAFQLHWKKNWLDIEILNLTIGLSSINKDSFSSMRWFTARSSFKVFLFDFISIGPLIGFEWVNFSDITVRLVKGGYQTPILEFSSGGLIYGGVLSQTFKIGKDKLIKISELFYVQTYGTQQTFNQWVYFYQNGALQADPSHAAIAPSPVFMLEVAFLL